MLSVSLSQSVRRVLRAQVVCALAVIGAVLAVAGVCAIFGGGAEALRAFAVPRVKAVAFGGVLGILSTAITARNVLQSSRAVAAGSHLGSAPLYSGLLGKILLVAGGTLLGLIYFDLGPLSIVLGYSTMPVAYLWAALPTNRPRPPKREINQVH